MGFGAGTLISAVAPRMEYSDIGGMTRAEILDNITLYWLTKTVVSAPRLSWKYKGGFFNAEGVSNPVALKRWLAERSSSGEHDLSANDEDPAPRRRHGLGQLRPPEAG